MVWVFFGVLCLICLLWVLQFRREMKLKRRIDLLAKQIERLVVDSGKDGTLLLSLKSKSGKVLAIKTKFGNFLKVLEKVAEEVYRNDR